MAKQQQTRDRIVAVRKDVGAHLDLLAQGALDGKFSTVDLRPNPVDDHPLNQYVFRHASSL